MIDEALNSALITIWTLVCLLLIYILLKRPPSGRA